MSDDNAYPPARPTGRNDTDPRLTCWFCGEDAEKVAPRHSGGDVDVAAYWVPVCGRCGADWAADLPPDERLPVFDLTPNPLILAEGE